MAKLGQTRNPPDRTVGGPSFYKKLGPPPDMWMWPRIERDSGIDTIVGILLHSLKESSELLDRIFGHHWPFTVRALVAAIDTEHPPPLFIDAVHLLGDRLSSSLSFSKEEMKHCPSMFTNGFDCFDLVVRNGLD